MIDVEQAFNAYVKNIGGELVSELLPKSPPFNNADYLFRKKQPEPVIAELKCLTKDLLKEGYQEKLDSLLENWIHRRLIPPLIGQHQLKSGDLPPECQEELFSMLGMPIKRIVAKANKQIKKTKEHFGLKNAKGLLFLVNDGNYSLEFDVLLYLINRALGFHCSSINSLVVFTVNMTVRMPGIDSDSLVWMPVHRMNMPKVSGEFLDWFRDGWIKFHGKMVGEPVSTFTSESGESIERIKFIHPPEPREYYKTRNRALVNLKREIAQQLDLVHSSCRLFDTGKRQEAIRIASAARIILYGIPNAPALIRDYFGDREIKLKSTTMVRMPSVSQSNFLGFFGLEANTGEFRPMLDSTKRNALLPLNEWWEVEPVLKLSHEKNETMTRKEIVLAAISSGEKLVSTDVQVKYARLVAGLGIKVMVRTAAGQDLGIVFRNANLAALRQIGHELLRSDELMALAR